MSAAIQQEVKERPILDHIFGLLSLHRFTFATEGELQDGIALVLTEANVSFEREFTLLPKDRIDFMVEDLGLEVKVAGSLSSVTRQLFRYAESPLIGSLLLVTSRIALHSRLPAQMNGKPLRVLRLMSSAI
jgi:hypothetical protein